MDLLSAIINEHCGGCPICLCSCMEIESPLVTECGHTMCQGCYRSYLFSTKELMRCPVCTHYIQHPPAVNYILKDIIDHSLKGIIKRRIQKTPLHRHTKKTMLALNGLAKTVTTIPKANLLAN